MESTTEVYDMMENKRDIFVTWILKLNLAQVLLMQLSYEGRIVLQVMFSTLGRYGSIVEDTHLSDV